MVQANVKFFTTDGDLGEGFYEYRPDVLSQAMAAVANGIDYDAEAHTVIGRKLAEILDAKGEHKGKYLMAGSIISDLSDSLTTLMFSTSLPPQTVQVVNNHIGNMRKYTGSVCPKVADRFLHELELTHNISVPERHTRVTKEQQEPAFTAF